MFKSISEYTVRLANLAEAEGRLARHFAIRLIIVLALALAATFTILAAMGFLAAALLVVLLPKVGAWSAVIVAGALLVLAGMFALAAFFYQRSMKN